jgi:tetratricopeptide (TPR) repeat protein
LRARGRRRWITAVAALATAVVHASMDTSSAADRGKLRVPDARHARLSALGFDSLVADYYWVQALQLVGSARGAVEDQSDTIAALIDVVTTLDPWVDHPYRFAALWLTRDIPAVRRGSEFLRRAVAYHPEDWRNRFYLGYNHFFYLEENQRAAEVLEPAIGMDGAPTYLGAFVTRLRAEGGNLDTAAFFLKELIRDAPDGFHRAEYLKALDEIETERRARYLDRARTEFWKRHGRDIERPSELWAGEARIIDAMPPPHPHFEGFEWVIDDESGLIVSSFYGSRYQLHIHPYDAVRMKEWHPLLEAEREAQEAGGAPDGPSGQEEDDG